VAVAFKLCLVLFLSLGAYLLISNLVLRLTLKKVTKETSTVQDKKFRQQVNQEANMRREMEERYRADMISYQVVTKRLEMEQSKRRSQAGETK